MSLVVYCFIVALGFAPSVSSLVTSNAFSPSCWSHITSSKLFSSDMLKRHDLLDEKKLSALLEYEWSMSSNASFLIHCSNMTMKSLLMIDALVVVYIDNNSSMICYYHKNISSDDAFHSSGGKSLVLPPALKLEESVVEMLNGDQWDSSANVTNTTSLVLFIELPPERVLLTRSVEAIAGDILHLEPLFHRYQSTSPSAQGINSSSSQWEWYHALEETGEVDRLAGQKGTWRHHVEQAVRSLASRPENDEQKSSLAKHVEHHLEHAHERCPSLQQSLLSSTTSTPVRIRESSIEVRLPIGGDSDDSFFLAEHSCFVHLVLSAALHRDVSSVSIGSDYHISNHDAVSVSQSGGPNLPLRSAGLLGRHQVCGVADTGLDDTSCFFRDDFLAGNASYRSPTIPRMLGVVQQRRRKVIQYVPYADSTDMEGGHGTHVCGTIAGQSIFATDSTSVSSVDGGLFGALDGVAPLAKISFFDIGYGLGSAVQLNLPRLYGHLFPTQYLSGARVSSNSWAGGSVLYGQLSREVDKFLYEVPSFLVVMSSGNRGLSRWNKIGSPANSKNALCIGATQLRAVFSDRLFPPEEHTASQFNSRGPTMDGRIKPDLFAPGYYLMSAFAAPVTEQLRAQRIQYEKTRLERSSRWTELLASGRCAVHEKSGSSMAAPVVSGTALLVREYFMNASYWLSLCLQQESVMGMCRWREPFEPSGYLVKAILLHAARPIPRYGDPAIEEQIRASRTLNKLRRWPLSYRPPAGARGYGELDVDFALPMPSSNGPSSLCSLKPVSLIVFDQLVTRELQTVEFMLRVEPFGCPLDYVRLTLCWYDPPSAVGWASSLLLHDIDLQMAGPFLLREPPSSSSPSEVLSYDSGRYRPSAGCEQHWGNGVLGGDHHNPNEQVHLHLSPATSANTTSSKQKHGFTVATQSFYRVLLRSHTFPLRRRVRNSDGSFTIAAVGTQEASLVITSNGRISLSEEYASPVDTDITQVCGYQLDENEEEDVHEKEEEEEAISIEFSDKKLDNDSRSLRSREDNKSERLEFGYGTIIDHHRAANISASGQLYSFSTNFSGIKLGIHQADGLSDKPIFGLFRNDVVTLVEFCPPTPSDGSEYTFVGVSICLESPMKGMSSFASPAVDAYLLAITITSPAGISVQVGGPQWQQERDKFFHRRWPFLWMSPAFDARRDMAGELEMYCRSSSTNKTLFPAFRDVSMAKLTHCGGSSANWTVRAAYGAKPNGYVPSRFFSGQITFYFKQSADKKNYRFNCTDYNGENIQPHKTNVKDFSSLNWCMLATVLFALFLVAFRANKLLYYSELRRDALDSTYDRISYRRFPLRDSSLRLFGGNYSSFSHFSGKRSPRTSDESTRLLMPE